jgi:hypothetical protein
MAQTLEDQWRIYRNACYPAGLPPLQETETRQAFFAGCLLVLEFSTTASQGLPDDQAYAFIMGLITEARTVCQLRIFEMKGRQ